jgi:hypothetical protein
MPRKMSRCVVDRTSGSDGRTVNGAPHRATSEKAIGTTTHATSSAPSSACERRPDRARHHIAPTPASTTRCARTDYSAPAPKSLSRKPK